MIAIQLPASDPGADLAAACVAVGFFGGGFAWMVWLAGRDAAATAGSVWGRRLGTLWSRIGRMGLAVAALALVIGAWVGLTTHSPAAERRSHAQAGCKQEARSRQLTGRAREDFLRQCVWERAD